MSLIDQSVRPEYLIVVDDGSTDKTPKILSDISARYDYVHIITNPDLGYDIGRVVENWNKALGLARQLGLEPTRYHMISTDDTQYEKEYCEKMIKPIMALIIPFEASAQGKFLSSYFLL